MVVNKMSLSLINECLSDNDNLNVIGCEALVSSAPQQILLRAQLAL